MNKQGFIENMIHYYGPDFDHLILALDDDSEAIFGRSCIWVGASDDEVCWGCDLLGNVEYDDHEHCVLEVADWVYDELKLTVVDIKC